VLGGEISCALLQIEKEGGEKQEIEKYPQV
jgi:hypothetical protein